MPRSRVGRSATIVDSTTKSLLACMTGRRSSQAVYQVGYSSEDGKDPRLKWPVQIWALPQTRRSFPCPEGGMRCHCVQGNSEQAGRICEVRVNGPRGPAAIAGLLTEDFIMMKTNTQVMLVSRWRPFSWTPLREF